jgi:hypothetical protein
MQNNQQSGGKKQMFLLVMLLLVLAAIGGYYFFANHEGGIAVVGTGSGYPEATANAFEIIDQRYSKYEQVSAQCEQISRNPDKWKCTVRVKNVVKK